MQNLLNVIGIYHIGETIIYKPLSGYKFVQNYNIY